MWAWPGSRDHDNCTVQTAAMGLIPRSTERILVEIKFESRPVLMSKHHDSLLFMVVYREALDRLCVRLNMYLVSIIKKCESKFIAFRLYTNRVEYLVCLSVRTLYRHTARRLRPMPSTLNRHTILQVCVLIIEECCHLSLVGQNEKQNAVPYRCV